MKNKFIINISIVTFMIFAMLNCAFATNFTKQLNKHLNEKIAFNDSAGVGKYFDVVINDRSYRFKTVLLNDRTYEQNDASYLILEKNNSIVDVGILSSGYYTVVVFNNRLNITDQERVAIQGEAAHGFASLGGTQAIIDEAERLSCEIISKKNYLNVDSMPKVVGTSGTEYYKENPYIMYSKMQDGIYYRASMELLLNEFAIKSSTKNGIPIYEYEGQKYTIDNAGIVIFAYDKEEYLAGKVY